MSLIRTVARTWCAESLKREEVQKPRRSTLLELILKFSGLG
jgi:hypothetical protein